MSIIKHVGQRVGVFIDTQNLYHSARNNYGKKVNFGAIVNDLIAKRILVRSIAYVITSDSGEESSFFEALGKAGIETRTKDLQVFADGSKKADWDVGISVDAIALSEKLDVVILLTGDGDFVPLVKYLQQSGIQVEAASFAKSSSGKLVDAVDHFTDLSQNTRKYLMGRSKRSVSRVGRKTSTASAPKVSNSRPDEKNSTSGFIVKRNI